MIHQINIYGRDKVDKAIMRLQTYEPPEGYYLCFSGGKDSCVINMDRLDERQLERETKTDRFAGLTAEEIMEWWINEL